VRAEIVPLPQSHGGGGGWVRRDGAREHCACELGGRRWDERVRESGGGSDGAGAGAAVSRFRAQKAPPGEMMVGSI
jgi:hypothetical protein